MVTLRCIGEDVLVGKLTKMLATSPSLLVSPGDDCAVVRTVGDSPQTAIFQLLKTDALVEHIHFLPTANPRDVGWKSVARVISDFAAMGGNPQHFLVTLALRPSTSLAWVEEIYRGISDCLERFGGHVAGGETTSVPEHSAQMISLAATGQVASQHLTLRSGAHVGDAIFVTGRLGGSLAGKHLTFCPRLTEAAWLCENFKPSAMMDVSDGLAKDLPRLAAASRCGFLVDEFAVPRTAGCSISQALNDGEDFELLFTISQPQVADLQVNWQKIFPSLELTCIGKMLAPGSAGQPASDMPGGGWDHFKSIENSAT